MNSPDYDFHPDLRPYSRMKTPLSPAFVSLVQKPMRLLYALEHDDKSIHVTRATAPIPKTDIPAPVPSNAKSISGIKVLIYETKDCE